MVKPYFDKNLTEKNIYSMHVSQGNNAQIETKETLQQIIFIFFLDLIRINKRIHKD